jgi:hypothetical protein
MFVAIQHSALSRFVYDLYDSKSNKVGNLCWPDIAVATNARIGNPLPGVLKSTIDIRLHDQLYEITFEYLTRNWTNDIKFMLLRESSILASAKVVSSGKFFKRSTITITEPFTGQLIRKNVWFAVRYELTLDGEFLGSIAEKSRLTVKREIFIDLPDCISAPVQFFLFFLVHNHAFR